MAKKTVENFVSRAIRLYERESEEEKQHTVPGSPSCQPGDGLKNPLFKGEFHPPLGAVRQAQDEVATLS